MDNAQTIRLAALDRAVTLHCSTSDSSRDAADVARSAKVFIALVETGDAPDVEADSEE